MSQASKKLTTQQSVLECYRQFHDPKYLEDQLVIPMDTHLFKISKGLRLTKRKTANWQTAIEVTRSLKKIDAQDPTKFDFSLCRIGMLKYRKMI